MLCKWKYRSEKMLAKKLSPDFLPCATRIQKVRICNRCCLCLRTASSVGQNSPGSNRASGPRFQRAAAASSGAIWPQPPLISPPRPQRSGGCEARKLEERVEVAARTQQESGTLRGSQIMAIRFKMWPQVGQRRKNTKDFATFTQNVFMYCRITCSNLKVVLVVY